MTNRLAIALIVALCAGCATNDECAAKWAPEGLQAKAAPTGWTGCMVRVAPGLWTHETYLKAGG